MDRNISPANSNEPQRPVHAHSWIWLVTAVVAISAFANAID